MKIKSCFFHISRLSILIIILESSHLHTLEQNNPGNDIHEVHPVLKAHLSPGDKCWKTEEFTIVTPCDLCTGNCSNYFLRSEINNVH